MGVLMTSLDYMANFGLLKLSESNPVHNGFTYNHNLTFIRLLENCATEFRGRIKFVPEFCMFINDPHSVKLEEILQTNNGKKKTCRTGLH